MNTIYTSTKRALSTLMLMALMLTGIFSDALAQTWTIGTGTTSNTTTGYPCIYGNFYWGARQQFIYRASELTAAGMTAGAINQIGFNVTGNAISQPNFYIALKNSATNALTAWETGMTTVYGPIPTQTTSLGWNDYNISSFSWDGTSNIILEVCIQGTGFTTNVQTQQTTGLPANTARVYRADASGVCTSGSVTLVTNTTRPNARFIRLSGCSGTPNAGTASGPSSACSAINFTLSATGLTIGSGISYFWQRSTDGGITWLNIPGANSPTAVVNQTVATQYRIYTLCSNGPADNVSNVVSVAMAPFWACYCAASPSPYGGATSTADEDIGNVTLVGQTITLNNTTTCASPASTAPGTPSIINQYQNYTNLATVPDLGQASSYNISLASITCGGNWGNGFKVWIDFDQSGTFDATEEVYNSPTALVGPHTESGTISIPGSATLGITGMLVKCIESTFPNANAACTSFTWGEAELYRVNIIATPPCSGTPAAGTASATPAGLVCPSTVIALSATGLTNAPGITYQWQANNTTLGGWTNLPAGGITVVSGSVNSAAVSITNQTENTQYRIFTNCSFGGSNVSNTVTRNNDVPTNCYCVPVYTLGNTSGDYINSVTLNTLSNLNTGANATTYTIYPTSPSNLTTSLDRGSNYDLIIEGPPSWTETMAAWIDYNVNGTFEPGEKLGEVSVPAGQSGTINFTVPNSATLGLTRLRVRCVWANSNIDPCASYSYGEVEDYSVTITQLPDCSGIPTGGTTVSSAGPNACTGIPFNLTVTGATSGVGGLTYQWQRNDGLGWTNMPSGTGIAYNGFTFLGTDPLSVQFRRRIVCTITSDTAYSSPITVNRTICYCATSFTGGNGAGYFISRVRVEGGQIDNTSTGAGAAPAYQDFTNTPNGTGTGSRGSYYWLRINGGTNPGAHYYGAWADWNQDGLFTGPNENLCALQYTTAPSANGSTTVNILFQVPNTAVLGTTRMRVRVYSTNPFAFLDPCTNYTTGETEDYDFVVTTSVCPPAGSVAGNLTGVSPTFTTNNDIVSPNITGGTGTLIRWEYSFNNFTTVAGSFIAYPIPAPFVHLNVNPEPFVYVRAVYQNEGCPSANSNVAFVKVDCANNITNGAQDNDNITNVRLRTLPGLITLIDNTSTFDPVFPDGYQDFRNISADVERGKQYELRITPQGTWSEHMAAWIDFNGDGVWANNEMVARSTTATTTAQTFTITIPCSLTNPNANYVGPVRMRVMTKFSGLPIDSNACSLTNYGWGEIEEYTLNILPLPNLVVTPPNAVCVPAGGTITASGGTGTYTWAPASGLSATTGATVTLNTIPNLQFYTVTGFQPGTGCAISQTFAAATLPVGGNAIPATSVVCNNGSKLFTASGSAGNLQWQTATSPTGPWTNVTGATNNTFNLTGITATTYVRVLVSSAACFDIASTTAVVHVSATPTVNIINVTSTSAVVTWTPYGSGQYNIAWTGAGTGSANAVTTNNYALSGLTPNTNLNVTVTLATPTCTGTSPGTATTKTLCAKPTITSLISVGGAPNPVGIRVNWTPVTGAPGYRIYFRNLSNNSNWLYVDTVGGTTKTIMQNVSGLIAAGADIAVYVAVNGCPSNPVTLGEGSSISYVTIPPTSSCTNVPTFTAVSNCPNQITVSGLSGSSSGVYDIQFRRIFPTVTSGVVYTTSSTTFNLTLGSNYAGSVYEVYARANCGATRGNYSPAVLVEVKPACAQINNPVISKITCYGATISWNADDCNGIGISGYYLYIKKQTATSYSAYPTGSTQTWKVVNWLAPNTGYDIYVRSVACNGSLSAASQVLQFTTGGPGCREEEAESVEAVNGNGEVVNIFPNPTNGNFSVSVNSTEMSEQEVRIEVINALGQVLVTNVTNMTGGNIIEGITLDNTLASGVYFVRVHVGNNVYVNRLVLSRD